MNEATTFGARVRELRKRASLTQRALAEKLGIHHAYPSMIESDRRVPSERIIGGLAAEFELETGELFVYARRVSRADLELAMRRNSRVGFLIWAIGRGFLSDEEIDSVADVAQANYLAHDAELDECGDREWRTCMLSTRVGGV